MRPIDTAMSWFSAGQPRATVDANLCRPEDRWPDIAEATRAVCVEDLRAARAATGAAAGGGS